MKKYLLGVLGLSLLFSCRKEQPPMTALNKECNCAKEVSADFSIEEIFGYSLPVSEQFRTEADMTFARSNVAFRAKEEGAEYTWYIGNEVLHDREVVRYFDDTWIGQTIHLSLVVKKKPNNICFPQDDGYDSIAKSFKIIMSSYDANDPYGINRDTTFLEGLYRVKSPQMNDSVDIVLDYRGEDNNGMSGILKLDVYNYNGSGANSINVNPVKRNYKECFSQGYLWGRFKVDINGVAIFDFKDYNSGNEIKYYYKGRKL